MLQRGAVSGRRRRRRDNPAGRGQAHRADRHHGDLQYKNQGKKAQQLTKAGSGPPSEFRLARDAELVDLGSRTRYQVARTGQELVAAKHVPRTPIDGVSLAPGKTLVTWAKFLVPAGVSKVMVTLPGASRPWENVAITP